MPSFLAETHELNNSISSLFRIPPTPTLSKSDSIQGTWMPGVQFIFTIPTPLSLFKYSIHGPWMPSLLARNHKLGRFEICILFLDACNHHFQNQIHSGPLNVRHFLPRVRHAFKFPFRMPATSCKPFTVKVWFHSWHLNASLCTPLLPASLSPILFRAFQWQALLYQIHEYNIARYISECFF